MLRNLPLLSLEFRDGQMERKHGVSVCACVCARAHALGDKTLWRREIDLPGIHHVPSCHMSHLALWQVVLVLIDRCGVNLMVCVALSFLSVLNPACYAELGSLGTLG